MRRRVFVIAMWLAAAAQAQTQVDLARQTRNALPYSLGGTNASSQTVARKNVGGPAVVATDFAGADIGAQVNAAIASFGAGRGGTVVIPEGVYTYSTTITVNSGTILRGMGRGRLDGNTGTKLMYNGPAATPAIHLPPGHAYSTVSDMSVFTNAGACPNNGMLKWNPGATGSNKWQCYDGTTYTTPIPHLAGILHGSTDPTLLADSTHIRVMNVDINGAGGQGGDLNQQGAFHIGLWFNGCEECVVESVYTGLADDGFSFGPASNGVLALQVTARHNRRTGIHVRAQNSVTFVLPLMEGNSWLNQPVQSGYGVGFLCDTEDLGDTVCRARMIDAYFEANWVDLSFPNSGSPLYGEVDGFQSVTGYVGESKLTDCVIPNAGSVTITGQAHIGCRIDSGTFNYSSNQARLFLTDGTGTVVSKVNKDDFAWGGRLDAYELSVYPTLSSELYLRGDPLTQLRLDNPSSANASGNTNSPKLRFRGSKWTGSAEEYRWELGARSSEANGAPESTSGLYIYKNGSQRFGFREDGELRMLSSSAKATVGDHSANDGSPELGFDYRSDADTATVGGRIRSKRFDPGAGVYRSGRLFFDDAKQVTFQNPAEAVTVAVKAGGAQSGSNLQEWQNSSGSVLAYVSAEGGLAVKPAAAQPACSAATRFLLWTTAGGAGVKDKVEVCAKDASDVYAWRTIY